MANCCLCRKPIIVYAIKMQFGKFITTTDFVAYETEFTCPECAFSGLYKQIQQADEELKGAFDSLNIMKADLTELRRFVAKGIFGVKS